jgi:NitT/TauT family transport system ATP-binding protein
VSVRAAGPPDTLSGSGPAIEIEDVSYEFSSRGRARKLALTDVTFSVPRSTFISVVGPSGCGKSTLLNLVSGLLMPTRGVIRVNGEEVTGIRSDIGYMPGSESLLPWRTVLDNVALPLELAGVGKTERYERSAEMLEAVGLGGVGDTFPHALSLGMRQRVAIARTFTAHSDIVLMDEPFSALDAQTRVLVQDVFLSIWEKRKPTVMLITHDVAEAVALSDQVVVFTPGPGTVDSVRQVDLSRPRSVEDLIFEDQEFQGHMRSIWKSLRHKAGAAQ